MKKRIMSLALCLMMLITAFVFSSCGEDNPLGPGGEGNPAYPPITINIFGITDDSTTEAAILKVEEALTDIAKKKYNITIDLHLFPEREYAAILFNKTQTAMNTYNSSIIDSLDEKDKWLAENINFSEMEGVRVASQIPSDVVGASLDIFLVYNPPEGSETLDPNSEYYNRAISNNGMFNVLYGVRALAPLKDKIDKGTYSALKGTSYAEALKYVERATYKTMNESENVTFDYFGIPNNYVYGSYEYIMFNKTYIDPLFSAEDKSDLAAPQTKERLPNGSVIVSDCPALGALKAELEYMKEKGELGDVEIERTFSSYEEFDKYTKSGKQVAIAIINGDKGVGELCKRSGLFDVYVREISTVRPTDLVQSMFCISASANERLDRCLQVMMLINTDANFRNTLQYGVKNIHYTEGRDGTVYVTGTDGDRYVMDSMYTGNNFILKPSDSMSESKKLLAADNWFLGKLQTKEVLDKYNNG